MLRSRKPKPPFQVLSKKTVFRGFISQLDVLTIRTSAGRRVERELLRLRGAAIVIPKLPDGRLILIRQLRVSTGRRIWEFPAGTLEKGESLIGCAKRELHEETGWEAGRIRKIVSFYPSPGISDEVMHIFLASRLRKSEPLYRDPEEEIRVHCFRLPQIERMIRRRLIPDGKTILGFLYYRYLLAGKS